MNVWRQMRRILKDPPPEFVFEISQDGIAFTRRQRQDRQFGFQPLEPDVLEINPLKDNVVRPEVLFDQVRALAPPNGKPHRHTAAIVLPDYCARVSVLEFANFPSGKDEQDSLVRFRLKKSIPFDLDAAHVSFYVQSTTGKNHEVVAAATALEIIARYEAAFRNAGFEPGIVTTSTLAALNLLREDGRQVMARLSGPVLSVAVAEAGKLRLLRCVELPAITEEEISAVLYPTFAYLEDELGGPLSEVHLCGFGELTEPVGAQLRGDFPVPVSVLTSTLGVPDATNAGLLGFLETTGA